MTCNNCSKKPVIELSGREKLCKKCFLRYFEKKVRKTIRHYELIDSKDKILVACSGGKDSTVILYLLKSIFPRTQIEAITIDASIKGYSEKNLENLKKVCKKYKIKLHEYSYRNEFGFSCCFAISALKKKGIKINNCAVCGTLRRYLLNNKSKELKANKLVTGHNLDDESQSVLMNLFKNNTKTMARTGPLTGIITDKKFTPRVKPLYFMTEEETTLFSKLMDFPVKYEICPCSEFVFRRQISNILNEFEKKHPGTKNSIIKSMLEIAPLIKTKYKGKINTCKTCKSPCSKSECDVCKIIKNVKS